MPNSVGTLMIIYCKNSATFLPTEEIVHVHSCMADGTWSNFHGNSSCCSLPEIVVGPTSSEKIKSSVITTSGPETIMEPIFCMAPNISARNIHNKANLTLASLENSVGTILLHYCNPPALLMPSTDFVKLYVCQADGSWSNLDGSTCEYLEAVTTTEAPFCPPPNVPSANIHPSSNVSSVTAQSPVGTLLLHYCQEPAELQPGDDFVQLYVCQSDGTWSNLDGYSCELPPVTTEAPYCSPPVVSTAYIHPSANVTIVGQKSHIGTLLVHHCQYPAVLKPSGEIVKLYVCQSDGTWDGLDGSICTMPDVTTTTEEPYCPYPNISAQYVHTTSNVTEAVAKNQISTLLVYFCEPPAVFYPPQDFVKLLTCQSDGTWSNDDGSICIPPEVITTTQAPYCSHPNVSTPYDHATSNISKLPDKSPVGTLLLHFCQFPAVLQPSGEFIQLYTCSSDGTWSNLDGSVCTPPTTTGGPTTELKTTTEPIFCGSPNVCTENINAASNITQTSAKNAIGTLLIHICQSPAYFPDDNSPIKVYVCNSDGTWNGISTATPCCFMETVSTASALSTIASTAPEPLFCPKPIICTDHIHSYSNATKAMSNENSVGTLLIHYCQYPAEFLDLPSPLMLYLCQVDGTWNNLSDPPPCCAIKTTTDTTMKTSKTTDTTMKTSTTTTNPATTTTTPIKTTTIPTTTTATMTATTPRKTTSMTPTTPTTTTITPTTTTPTTTTTTPTTTTTTPTTTTTTPMTTTTTPTTTTTTTRTPTTTTTTTTTPTTTVKTTTPASCTAPNVCSDQYTLILNIDVSMPSPVGALMILFCINSASFLPTDEIAHVHSCMTDGTWSNFQYNSSCCSLQETTVLSTTSTFLKSTVIASTQSETTTEPTICPAPNVSTKNIHPKANLTLASAVNQIGTILLHFCDPPTVLTPPPDYVKLYVCQNDGTWSNLDGSTCEYPEVITTTEAPFCLSPNVSLTYVHSASNITSAAAQSPVGTLLVHLCQAQAVFQPSEDYIKLHICQSDGTWSNLDGACELPLTTTTTESPYCAAPNVSKSHVHRKANLTRVSGKNEVGTLVLHFCESPAVLQPSGVGFNLYVCQSDGTWGGLDGSVCTMPEVITTTEEPYCPPPDVPNQYVHTTSNVTQAGQKNQVGTLLVYFCQPPAVFQPVQPIPVKLLICLSDGAWSGLDGTTCVPPEVPTTTTEVPYCTPPNVSSPYDHNLSNISQVSEKSTIGTLLLHYCQPPTELQPSGEFIQLYVCLSDGTWSNLDGSVCTDLIQTEAATTEAPTTVVPITCGSPNICMGHIHPASNFSEATTENPIGTLVLHICQEPASFSADGSIVNIYVCSADGKWSGIDVISPCCLTETTTPPITTSTTTALVCPAPDMCMDNLHQYSNLTSVNSNVNPVGTLLVQYCEDSATIGNTGSRMRIYECQSDGTWSNLENPPLCCETVPTTTEEPYCGPPNVCTENLHPSSNVTNAAAMNPIGTLLVHFCDVTKEAVFFDTDSPAKIYKCNSDGTWSELTDPPECCSIPTSTETTTDATTTNQPFCGPDNFCTQNLHSFSNITNVPSKNPVGTLLIQYCKYPYILQESESPVKLYTCQDDGTWRHFDDSACCMIESPKLLTTAKPEGCAPPSVTLDHIHSFSTIQNVIPGNIWSPVGTSLIHFCESPYTFPSLSPFRVYKCTESETWTNVGGSCG